jgi:hypothetical protein
MAEGWIQSLPAKNVNRFRPDGLKENFDQSLS